MVVLPRFRQELHRKSYKSGSSLLPTKKSLEEERKMQHAGGGRKRNGGEGKRKNSGGDRKRRKGLEGRRKKNGWEESTRQRWRGSEKRRRRLPGGQQVNLSSWRGLCTASRGKLISKSTWKMKETGYNLLPVNHVTPPPSPPPPLSPPRKSSDPSPTHLVPNASKFHALL